MEIRQIQPSDSLSFINLNRQLCTETDFLLTTVDEVVIPVEKQATLIQAMHEQQLQMVFVAEQDGQLVGFIGVTCFPLRKVRHIARFAIGVLTAQKRLGVGKALLSAAEAWLKPRGVSRFEMTVIAQNQTAIAFYKACGFTEEGVRKNAIFMQNAYFDEVYMAKLI